MLFNHRYRYLFIVILSLYTLLNTLLCDVYHYFNIDIEWYYALLTITGITFLTWEGNRLVKPYFKKKFLTPRNKIRFLGFFFLAGNIIAPLSALLVVYFVGNVIHGYTWQQNSNPIKLNIIYSSLINLFFHLINAIFFFFREYRRQWEEVEELRRTSAQAQIQLIKNQVNPHFLFNNLNVLSGMVIKNNPGANHFIEEFSKVYRYILTNQDKELVPVKEELDFIEPYIFLLRQRFTSGLQIDIDVPDKYNDYYIIPAALQMLIENAIKHNVVSVRQPLHIMVHANGDESIMVSNNIQLRQTNEPSTRIGLQNIARRYELLNQKDIVIKNDTKSFEVVLPLIRLN